MGPSWKKKKILKIEFYLENVFFWKIIINLKTQSKLERNEGKELKISLIEWKAKNKQEKELKKAGKDTEETNFQKKA